MKIFLVKFKNHFSNASGVLIYLITIPIILTYEYNVHNKDDFEIAILMFGSLALFHNVVAAVIHINYYLINKHDVFEFHDDENYKIITKNSESILFSIEDIYQVTTYTSFALNKKNIQLLAWDSYNHMIIELNSGTKITLTSLLMGIHNPLKIPKEKLTIKMSFFRWVHGRSVLISVAKDVQNG